MGGCYGEQIRGSVNAGVGEREGGGEIKKHGMFAEEKYVD